MNQSFLIFGREPSLSLAELYQYLGQDSQKITSSAGEAVLIDDADFGSSAPSQLAGVIKSGVIIKTLAKITPEDIAEILRGFIKTEGKFCFGLSSYNFASLSARTTPNPSSERRGLKSFGLEVKKLLKAMGASVRLVESRNDNLSSVDVVKNKLLSNGVELCIIKIKDSYQIGQTLAVQPFEEYSERDYGRPGRDARSGMLPPKLAKAMVNIAVSGSRGLKILDPFCGSGTVLQEALLLGHNVIGTDIETSAIAGSKKNIEWLVSRHTELAALSYRIEKADVRQIGNILSRQSVDAIVSEFDLGPPLSGRENEGKIKSIVLSLNDFYLAALHALQPVLKDNGRAVLAWPYFRKFDSLIPAFDELENLGWRSEAPYPESFKKDFPLSHRDTLLYGRPDQHVWREIIILKKIF